MAKTASSKKREVSVHSRAARRGDPEIHQTGKSRKAPVEESDYKPWLHSAQNSGVGKKTKQLTRQQRLRQQRGLEKAEVNLDKLDKKVADSKSRGKKVNARRVEWDELNEKLSEKKGMKEKQVEKMGESSDGAVRPMDDVVATDLDQPGSLATDDAPDVETGNIGRVEVPSTILSTAAAPIRDDEVDGIT